MQLIRQKGGTDGTHSGQYFAEKNRTLAPFNPAGPDGKGDSRALASLLLPVPWWAANPKVIANVMQNVHRNMSFLPSAHHLLASLPRRRNTRPMCLLSFLSRKCC